MKLTNEKRVMQINSKEAKTEEDIIYLALSRYESEELYTKSQLNMAVAKAIEMLANVVKNKVVKELIMGMVSELKIKEKDGKVDYKDIEDLGSEIIRKVEEIK